MREGVVAEFQVSVGLCCLTIRGMAAGFPIDRENIQEYLGILSILISQSLRAKKELSMEDLTPPDILAPLVIGDFFPDIPRQTRCVSVRHRL